MNFEVQQKNRDLKINDKTNAANLKFSPHRRKIASTFCATYLVLGGPLPIWHKGCAQHNSIFIIKIEFKHNFIRNKHIARRFKVLIPMKFKHDEYDYNESIIKRYYRSIDRGLIFDGKMCALTARLIFFSTVLMVLALKLVLEAIHRPVREKEDQKMRENDVFTIGRWTGGKALPLQTQFS